MKRPRIGLTPDLFIGSGGEAEFGTRRNYATAIRAAGGVPLLLPPGPDVADLLDAVDALVVTGGLFALPPDLYGGPVIPGFETDRERIGFELALIREALTRDMPYLGICNGMQLLAIALGGGMVHDIGTEITTPAHHAQHDAPDAPAHPVRVVAGTRISAYAQGNDLTVNSFHRQAVRPHSAYAVAAEAMDGVVEAIELPSARFCIGVQWHPEYGISSADAALWRGLIAAAR